jgi:hypothetical protein
MKLMILEETDSQPKESDPSEAAVIQVVDLSGKG